MKSYTILPDLQLRTEGEVALEFLKLRLQTFHKGCDYVLRLPYGRISDRMNYLLVLKEGKGACSSKHALIAALAKEHNIEVELTVGIYEMNESNTPGVGPVLSETKFEYIPEAHCYLTFENERIDITRTIDGSADPVMDFLHEEYIQPDQIGEYKVQLHKSFLREWAGSHDIEEIWTLREKCIQALCETR